MQQGLGASLGWDKSRLSHQLTRMEGRGLVHREKVGSGSSTRVLISPKGRRAIAAARPVHAAAVREHVLKHVNPEDAKAIIRVMISMQGAKS